jgi:hypothetical protein
MSQLIKPAYIERSYYTDLLLNHLERKHLKPRDEYPKPHVSTICPRQGVFTELDPNRKNIKDVYFKDGKPVDVKTIPITERVLMYYYDGEAVDEKTRKTFMEGMPGNYDTDCHLEYGPVTGTPDLIDLDRRCVIELKTIDPSAETWLPKDHNMLQLLKYMAIMDYKDGVLWYHIITRKKDDELWREFHVELNETERAEIRNLLLPDGQRTQQALDERDPYMARHVADDDTVNKWMCVNYCPYVEQCPEGWAFREQYFIDHPRKKPVVKNLTRKFK